MFRILRPGGRLAICAWLAAENPSAWQTRTLLEPICAEGQLAGLGSETEYDGLLRQAEFDGIEFIDLTPCVARTWTIICRRVLMRLARDRATWRFLARRPKNAVFGLAIPRIVLAYRTRAMRYGLFVARRPERGGRMVESTSARAESRA
jgi:tocopherol O-methyltransferase